MSVEMRKTLIKNLDTQLFELVSNLICSICQDLLNKPVTTPCGHSFCNGCIRRVLSSKDNSGCPLCKNPVKRYCLKADPVKSTLSEICKELPAAFKNDVKAISAGAKETEDFIQNSKLLTLLYNQEFVKESKTMKRKTSDRKSKKSKTEATENEAESFIPVLKRSKRVFEYASAKKKRRLDDLVSVSQTDPASNSSLCGSFEVDKKLEKIEKIRPEEKVAEWFDAVGDNIYINSPSSSIVELAQVKNQSEEKSSSMIRVDYKKGEHSEPKAVDPYEFIPSQNKSFKRKRQKRAPKKIPDFKALQNFTKESIRRNIILQKEDEEELNQEDDSSPPPEKVTASQKFDQLLSETKENESKPPAAHALYSASQASSPRFLDCSFHSRTVEEKKEEKKRRKGRKLPTSDEEEPVLLLESNAGLFTECATSSGEGRTTRSKRRSLDLKSGAKKTRKLFSEVIEVKSDEVSEPPEVGGRHKQTRLMELLKELLEDEVIYSNRASNAGVKLSEMEGRLATQNTELLGFSTQEESPEVKRFKRMVEKMERELDSSELSLAKSLSEEKTKETPAREVETEKTNKPQQENTLIVFNLLGKIGKSKNCFVEFLHLGRLSPTMRRSKSSAVKLLLPSFAEKRTKFEIGVQTTESDVETPSLMSAGIQTSQKMASEILQTTAAVQTEERPSVEVQTTQRWTSSAGIQTTQALEVESAQVQTSQNDFQTPRTRKPASKHRKIIRKDDSPTHLFSPEEEKSDPKNLINDYDVEKEFENTWMKSTQKHHEDLVEVKNQKNRERNLDPVEGLGEESDDSDVQPPKRTKNTRRILSQDSLDLEEKYEIRQMIPLTVRKFSHDEEMEVIDLETPKSQNSEEQMLRVLKNIDLDLSKSKKRIEPEERGEKSEESDSDFFIEQTPPRPATESKNLSLSLSLSRSRKPTPKKEEEEKKHSEGTDLIEDSIPKGFSESFLLPSAPQKVVVTPEKRKSQSRLEFLEGKTNENDQNQLNAKNREVEAKTAELKAVVEAWKRSETPKKRGCVVASGVKNPETIKKFVSKFKMGYSNTPTKEMTHLIVGLHENEEGDSLPLCTPKLLFAMANKKWVVSEFWAEASVRADAMLPEEKFETLDPLGGCGCRRARLFPDSLLGKCEIYLLGSFETISKEDFAALILDCGGTLVPTPEEFSFSPSKLRMIVADGDCLQMNEKQLQDLHEKHSTVILSRDVIIMSIQTYKLPNFWPYLLHAASEESLIKLGYPSSMVRRAEQEGEAEAEGEAGRMTATK